MIKHLIKFEGMQIALNRVEIAQLHAAIEPYLVGILNAVPDHELPKFTKQHMKDLYSKRTMVKERKPIHVKAESPQKTPQRIETPADDSNVVNLGNFRQQKKENKG